MTDTDVFTFIATATSDPRTAGDVANRGQEGREELRRVLPPGPCGLLRWYLGSGGGHAPIAYPGRFKVLAVVTACLTLIWTASFIVHVQPALNITSPAACKFADEQLRHSTKLLALYFSLVVVVRIAIFIPGVATRYVLFSPELAGPCYYYTAHIVLHGPLYAFSCSVLLFWVQLMQSPDCVERNKEFYTTLQWSATQAIFVAVAYIALSVWHFRLLSRAVRVHREETRKAPPGTLQKLPTVAYDEALFGDEDGKRYPAECAICLDDLSNDESGPIKVLPCGHVFHEACLRDWLETSRICALCRHDVTRPWQPRFSAPDLEASPNHLAATPSTSATVPAETLGASTPSSPWSDSDPEAQVAFPGAPSNEPGTEPNNAPLPGGPGGTADAAAA